MNCGSLANASSTCGPILKNKKLSEYFEPRSAPIKEWRAQKLLSVLWAKFHANLEIFRAFWIECAADKVPMYTVPQPTLGPFKEPWQEAPLRNSALILPKSVVLRHLHNHDAARKDDVRFTAVMLYNWFKRIGCYLYSSKPVVKK